MRRSLLAVALLLAGTACSAGGGGARNGASTSSEPTTSTTTVEPGIRWQAGPQEPAPEVKRAAADLLWQVLNPPPGGDAVASARDALAQGGHDPGIADDLGPLLRDGSAADVVYPQLAGVEGDRAAVMAVVRQRRASPGDGATAVSRTLDVRLERRAGVWRVVDVPSLGGDPPPARVPLSASATAVLESRSIELPDSARWDVEAGRVDERVLALLVEVAAEHRLGVTVLASGHPPEVFATAHTSNHTVGRAVDVWSVDGIAVADRQDDESLRALGRRLLAAGATELGGPWDLDGPRGASFANLVHRDHLHVGFDR